MYAEERQHEIVRLARESGRVSVSELAGRFEVTAETIRRDLDALAHVGLVSRVHGGAVPAEKLRLTEATVGIRETALPAEKRAIASAALAQLPPREGLSVLIDAGTTTARLAELLQPGQVSTVVTNSLPAAASLAGRGGFQLLMLGGEVRGITQATVGATALDILGRLHIDVAFLGTNGFSAHGFTTPDPTEAAVKRAMAACAREVVVMADSSKFGADFLVTFAACEDVDVLVTDRGLPTAGIEQMRVHGVEVVLADPRP